MKTDQEIKKISKENIKKASEIVKDAQNRKDYIEFMTIRFGDYYLSEGYAKEWASRFNKDVLSYCDLESRKRVNKIRGLNK